MCSYGLMNLQREEEKVSRLVFDIGFKYLHGIKLRSRFMCEENSLSKEYINDYLSGKIIFSEAMNRLRSQYERLIRNQSQLQMGSIKLYAIAEREKDRHSLLTITLKRVGFVSGSMQAIGGFGICKANIGAACRYFGVPLMIQGSENVWENGYYLLYHEDPKVVPVRYAYRQAAKFFGGEGRDGDIAFSSGDIALSLGSASTLTLKSDSWKLFHYIREDYIHNWRTLGAVGGINELAGDAVSGFSIYQIAGVGSTNWEALGR